MQFGWSHPSLTVDRSIELPMSPTGHDLFPLREQAKLLVSNESALFLFDITTEQFETVSEIKDIKSVNQHQDATIWITEPKKISDAAPWHSDGVLRVRPNAPEIRHHHANARFYIVRWWQKVSFSY